MTFLHKKDKQSHNYNGKNHLYDTANSKAVFIIINQMKIANKKRKKNDAAYNSCIKIQSQQKWFNTIGK